MTQTPSNSLLSSYKPELANLKDLQRTFVRNVEHQLRTPLSIVQGYAELLHSGELGQLTSEQQRALFTIVTYVDELRTLVDRIGVLMEVEGQIGVTIPLALNEILAEVINDKYEAAAQAGLTLAVHLAQDTPPVAGDPRHLQQIFDCLLENAIKFTPAGGHITVQVYSEAGWVCGTVSDTGIGIEEGKITGLFSDFYQADDSPTRQYDGIGLGLTLTRTVVEAHAGQIELESRPGQGSRFTVKLPILAGANALHADGVDQVDTAQASLSSLPRILVVDDEKNLAVSLGACLKNQLNCEVIIATNGEGALRLFEQYPFDLLVTDYKMPGMDGVMLATLVRQLYPLVPIVMITAYSDELREQANSASISRVLDKPVELEEIQAVALEALEGVKPCPERNRKGDT